MRWSKVRKSLKLRGVGPVFGVYKGLVVVIREGCEGFLKVIVEVVKS